MENTRFTQAHIRWMIRRDLDKVLEIENANFDCAWDQKDFLNCLRQRNCIGMVAEVGNKVLGFMIYALHKHYLELINFAVHPEWHRQKIGHQMVAKMTSKLAHHRRTKINLKTRESNLKAQLFFKAEGFKAVKIYHRWFDDSNEDAYEMRYSIGEEMELEEEEVNCGSTDYCD